MQAQQALLSRSLKEVECIVALEIM